MADCDRADFSNAIGSLDQEQLAKYLRSCFSSGGTRWLIEALRNSTDQELEKIREPLMCCLCGDLRESGASAVDSSLLKAITDKYDKWRIRPVWAIINADHGTEIDHKIYAAKAAEEDDNLDASYAASNVGKPAFFIGSDHCRSNKNEDQTGGLGA